MSDESKMHRRRALRNASDRLRAGDQNLFTRPYSDQIPLDDELKGYLAAPADTPFFKQFQL